jgi:AcrR family transcriptional regulator
MVTKVKRHRGNGRTGRRPAAVPSGRQVLVEAALKLFGLYGYQGASLRGLAREAGVDIALVTRLFGSKAGLWDAMLDDLVEKRIARFDARLDGLQDPSRPLAVRLKDMIDLFIDIAGSVPDFLRLLLQDDQEGDGRISNAVEKLVLPVKNGMAPVIIEGIAAKLVRDINPDMVFLVMTSTVAVAFGAPLFLSATAAPATQADLPNRLRDALTKVLFVSAS